MNKTLYVLCVIFLTVGCIPSRPRTAVVSQNKSNNGVNIQYELPAIINKSTIVVHTGYTSSFNSTLLIPDWVAYELTATELNGQVSRPSNSPFQPDPDFKGIQPERTDYSRSGWDKGHLAPCADMKWSEQAMFESFYFTNVCPQNHDFNEKDWQKLENKARNIARKKGSLYIICGPLVTTNEYGKLGSKGVVIPDYYFKALMYKDNTGFHSIAYLMPNKYTGRPVDEFAMSVNDLEKIIGLDLFTQLDDNIEENVESQLSLTDWQ